MNTNTTNSNPWLDSVVPNFKGKIGRLAYLGRSLLSGLIFGGIAYILYYFVEFADEFFTLLIIFIDFSTWIWSIIVQLGIARRRWRDINWSDDYFKWFVPAVCLASFGFYWIGLMQVFQYKPLPDPIAFVAVISMLVTIVVHLCLLFMRGKNAN